MPSFEVRHTTRTSLVTAEYVKVEPGGTLVFYDRVGDPPILLINGRDWTKVILRG